MTTERFQRHNTGRFRIRKEKIGIPNTKRTVIEFDDRQSTLNYFNNLEHDPEWTYYCEEEVYFSGTQKDQDNNPIDSANSWVRMQ